MTVCMPLVFPVADLRRINRKRQRGLELRVEALLPVVIGKEDFRGERIRNHDVAWNDPADNGLGHRIVRGSQSGQPKASRHCNSAEKSHRCYSLRRPLRCRKKNRASSMKTIFIEPDSND